MFAASPALSGPSTLSLHLHRDLAIRWLAPQPVYQRRVPAPPAPAPNGPSLHSSRLPVPASASHPALASTLQPVPFLLTHPDLFHPSALRLSRGTFYFGQLGTFHLAATRSALGSVVNKSRCPVLLSFMQPSS